MGELYQGEDNLLDVLAEAFGYVGLDWEKYTHHDSRYERPSEVEQLLGDPSKAKRVLGWEPKVTFKGLVKMMMDSDLKLAEKETLTFKANRDLVGEVGLSFSFSISTLRPKVLGVA